MLSEYQKKHINPFKGHLSRLVEQVTQANLDAKLVGHQLRIEVTALQTQLQVGRQSLNVCKLFPSEGDRVEALWVEMDKQLRLLHLDSLFLQTAKQPETRDRRQQQMADRLQLLIHYCDQLLQLICD